MAKIKLTKGELKRQRDALGQFRRYLPTLQLKKQQLQITIGAARKRIAEQQAELEREQIVIQGWAGVLADPEIARLRPDGRPVADLAAATAPKKIRLGRANIAGAHVPVLEAVEFDDYEIDPFEAPLWLERGIAALRVMVKMIVAIAVMDEEVRCLERELRSTSQRVNLFEKIKIPECEANIRKIMIYMGDQQANAVGISKVAKKKIETAGAAGAAEAAVVAG